MDWWQTGLGSSCSMISSSNGSGTGTGGGGPTAGSFVSSSQLDLNAHLDLGPNQGADFDPWLTADDLDLGDIIQHAGSATLDSPSSDASSMPAFSVGCLGAELVPNQVHQRQQQKQFNANQQADHLGPIGRLQTNRNVANSRHHQQQQQQTRLPIDNKRHIISIINNSLPISAYNQNIGSQQQPHLQQAFLSNLSSSSSAALSPLSSSLVSSPLNSNSYSSSISSSSPISSSTNNHHASNEQANLDNQTTSTAHILSHQQQHHQHHQQQQNLNQAAIYCFPSDCCNSAATTTATTTGVYQQLNQFQSQQTLDAGSNTILFANTSVARSASSANRTTSKSKTTSGQPKNGRQNKTLDKQQQQLVTNACSSLLTETSKTSSGQQKQTKSGINVSKRSTTTTTTSTAGANSKSASNQNTAASGTSQKLRRCRHITDYVLADEEKRLLIKEGYLDFPNSCQARPLTKVEERILRKIRRKIRNKKSAQCSRQRKKEYVEDLERKYATVVRENGELKQLLAKFQQQQQQQQQQQPENGRCGQIDFNHHLLTVAQTFSDEAQTSCSSESQDLDWKDLFQAQNSISNNSNRVGISTSSQQATSYNCTSDPTRVEN